MPARVRLGAHVSIAGGLPRAFERAAELGCDTLQLFVKNPSQWAAKPLGDEVAEEFRRARAASGAEPLVAHAAYLINLAATDDRILERSRRALADELERCDLLGVDALVVHPGAHMGAGEEAGIERIAESLAAVLSRRRGGARLLLENTAGQGTVLGYRLGQLARMRRGCGSPPSLGVCIDTCHAFAAGYAIDRKAGYEALLERLFELFAPADLGCLHLNDSRRPRGSRRDRHANLGEGEIGIEAFRRLVNDPRLAGVPMILETPRGDDEQGHRRDLDRLRSLLGRGGPGRPGRPRVAAARTARGDC